GSRLLESFGSRSVLTTTVLRELERKVIEFANIRPLLDRWPADQVLGLSPQQREAVIDLMRAYQLEGEHPRSHEGEFATCIKARQLRDEGTSHVNVIDAGQR